MAVSFEIEENSNKTSNRLFESGAIYCFDFSNGEKLKFVNWLSPLKVETCFVNKYLRKLTRQRLISNFWGMSIHL